jgi:hypothetical protein
VVHPDAVDPERRVWTVNLSQRSAISIRVISDSQPCDVALNKLKAMAKAKNVTIREFSVNGRPAWEEPDWRRGADSMIFERYVCGMGRFYVLTLAWPAAEHKPKLGVEIMDSFRLLK